MVLGTSFASIIGNPLSGAIMGFMDGWAGLAGWQWVFVIEGLPATLLGDRGLHGAAQQPGRGQMAAATKRRRWSSPTSPAEKKAQTEAGLGHRFADAFRNPNIWCIVVANFCNLSTLYGIQFWLPTIIQKVGKTSVFNTGLIASGLALIPCVVLILNARHSDRTRERRWHAAFGFMFSALGLRHRRDLQRQRLSGPLGADAGPLRLRDGLDHHLLPAGHLRDGAAAAAASFALITTLGNFAGYTTPYLFGVLKDATGNFSAGFYGMSAIAAIGALAILTTPALRPGKRGAGEAAVLAPQ